MCLDTCDEEDDKLTCVECGKELDVYKYIEQYFKTFPTHPYIEWCNIHVCCTFINEECDKKIHK